MICLDKWIPKIQEWNQIIPKKTFSTREISNFASFDDGDKIRQDLLTQRLAMMQGSKVTTSLDAQDYVHNGQINSRMTKTR